MRRTLQRNKRHYQKTHGFRARTQSGSTVLKARRAKGRAVLAR
ncbi:MAG: 50S ribosomal protein L34 [Candidatus Berkelbacteria bacterium]|nr:MAG: 50S ribosomal protein L34 [Candidatus Berkelbacteria bacterium]QQG51718.1 MAG: 50S ribosomal protein L34 [Candidatus Berkelbacteria bacterium]